MQNGKKRFLHRFGADQKIASLWKQNLFWASYSTSNNLLLGARHIMTTGLQKCRLSWHCKLCEFTVTTFHCEESTHWK